MCGDPQPAKMWSHAEDYSEPYNWEAPASYPLCDPCHKRLHARFAHNFAWKSYHAFLRRGWYGREVTSAYLRRFALRGDDYSWPIPRHEPPVRSGSEPWWWEVLDCDPDSRYVKRGAQAT